MRRILLTCLLLLTAYWLQAQDTIVTDLWSRAKKNPNLGRFKFIEMKIHSGSHLYNGDALSEFLERGYESVEVRLGWQSTGMHDWEKAFNYPSYGLGFYTGWIGDPTILGNPSGLYSFFNVPLHRRKRHHFEAGLALGFTYDLNTYNPKTNPLNDAISSKVDVYFNLSAGGVWKVSEQFDLMYGVDLTHFSNGRTHTPNLGLNMAGVNIGVRYHYNTIRKVVQQLIDSTYLAPLRPTFITSPMKPVRYGGQLSLYGAFGVVQNDSHESNGGFYGTASVVLDYSWRYDHIGSFGGGIDGFYDGSLGTIYAKRFGRVRTSDKMLAGAHIGHILHIQRFDIVTQAGTYFWRRDGEKGDMFLRVALRYNVSKYGFLQVGLKTLNGAAADWIEWGGGGKIGL